MNERAEPRTAAGLRLYHGIAIRGLEHKALRDILAIEVEAAGLAVMAVDDDYGAAAAPQPSALRAALERLADRVDSYCDHGDPDPGCLDSLHACSADIRALAALSESTEPAGETDHAEGWPASCPTCRRAFGGPATDTGAEP